MAFAKSAVALLSLLTIANAERSLQAHKASSGALHVVALGSCVPTTPPSNPGTACASTSSQFIYQTNGNGTWYNASSGNSAFLAASAYTGSLATTAGQSTTSNSAGVNAIAFPSQTLGVVVGASYPNAPFPSILTSVDQGLTWQKVTGFGGAVPAGFVNANNTAPDLNSVYAVSRSLIFAAGGYQPQPSNWTTAYQAGNATLSSLLATPGLLDTNGAIYASTNGGTVWNSVPLPPGTGSIYAIAADASGKHVYAVGTPSTLVTPGSVTSLASPFAVFSGAILYSGNYGQTWTTQAAPVIPGYTYQLTSVAVLRGTMAFAVGGSPYPAISSSSTCPQNGVIVGTANGGFSWLQQSITNVPGYTQSAGTIPYLYGLGFNVVSGSYVGWAVGGVENATSTTSTPVPLVLMSNSIVAATQHSTQATYLNTVWQPAQAPSVGWPKAEFSGIIWDNNNVGYIYGVSVILSTHDAGKHWSSETPAGLVLSTVDIVAAAAVPTTY